MHTYIFSILPIIQLYFQNCLEFNPWHILGIIGIVCLVNAFLYHGLSFFFKKHRSGIAILVSMWWLIFWFAIPAARYILGGVKIPAWILAYKWFAALILSLSALGVLSIFLLYFRRYCLAIDRGLRVFGVIALVVVVVSGLSSFQKVENTTFSTPATVSSDQPRPNVYHILLDGYTNYDILKEEYGYDNAAFYQALEDLGFICFPSSHSNYPGTLFSMSSVLNFGYVHDKFYDTAPLSPALQASLLKKLNSNTVWPCFIKNNYRLHLLDHTGIYSSNNKVKNHLKDDAFQKTIFIISNNTLFRNIISGLFLKKYYTMHVEQIKAIFSHLQHLPEVEGLANQYTYAHVLCPHEPFVLDADGSILNEQTLNGFIIQKACNEVSTPEENKQYKKNYVNQVKALNNLVLPAIESILKQHAGSQPPIIILHADHGWPHSSEEDPFHSLANLFAVYVPPAWREEAKTLEFINLYRFICNHLCGMDYPYQESQYFYSGKE